MTLVVGRRERREKKKERERETTGEGKRLGGI